MSRADRKCVAPCNIVQADVTELCGCSRKAGGFNERCDSLSDGSALDPRVVGGHADWISTPRNSAVPMRANAITHESHIGNTRCAIRYIPCQRTQVNSGISFVQGSDRWRCWRQMCDVAPLFRLMGLAKYGCALMSMSPRRIFQKATAITTIAIAIICNSTYAAQAEINNEKCLAYSTTHKTYEQSIYRLLKVKEVDKWKTVLKKANRIVASNPAVDKTVFLKGKCFWEISLYEISTNHLVLWNTYQIAVDGSSIYQVDNADPNEQILIYSTPTSITNKK